MNRLDTPVYVSGCARSGTSLLFYLLSSSPELWSIYREEHGIYEWEIGLHPDYKDNRGNLLTIEDVTTERTKKINDYFSSKICNTELIGIPRSSAYGKVGFLSYYLAYGVTRFIKRLRPNAIRYIDKNPKHVYRVEFLRAMHPDSKFVFIIRDGRSNIASLLEGWESGKFETYKIPVIGSANDFIQWSFELPPMWREWVNTSFLEIAAHQWVAANDHILSSARLLGNDCLIVSYENLVFSPEETISKLCDFLGLESKDRIQKLSRKPPNVNTVSLPDKDKWKQRKAELRTIYPIIEEMQYRLGYDLS